VWKFGSAAPPRGRNIVFWKRHFKWVQFHIEISKVAGPSYLFCLMRKESPLIKCLTDFEYLYLFRRYSPLKFKALSLIGGKISGLWNSSGGKVTWPELKCISICRMCSVDMWWVNMHIYNFFVSGPKFTFFLCSTWDELHLIMQLTACRYLFAFQRYLRSKLKVVLNRTKFWTFSAFQILTGWCPLKSCPRVITPT